MPPILAPVTVGAPSDCLVSASSSSAVVRDPSRSLRRGRPAEVQRPRVLDRHVSRLLFVVSVDDFRKLACQAPDCGRAHDKAIHVIRDMAAVVRLVGAGCCAILSGHEQATTQGVAIRGFDGRRLTPDERASMLPTLQLSLPASKPDLQRKAKPSDRLRTEPDSKLNGRASSASDLQHSQCRRVTTGGSRRVIGRTRFAVANARLRATRRRRFAPSRLDKPRGPRCSVGLRYRVTAWTRWRTQWRVPWQSPSRAALGWTLQMPEAASSQRPLQLSQAKRQLRPRPDRPAGLPRRTAALTKLVLPSCSVWTAAPVRRELNKSTPSCR